MRLDDCRQTELFLREPGRVILGAGGDLDDCHADLGREEFLVVCPLVRVSGSAAVVFNDEILLLDTFGPNNGVILPKALHRNIFFEDTSFTIDVGTQTAIAVFMAFIRDVTNAPRRWFAANC